MVLEVFKQIFAINLRKISSIFKPNKSLIQSSPGQKVLFLN